MSCGLLNSLHPRSPKHLRLPAPPRAIPPLISPALHKEDTARITIEVRLAVKQEEGEAEEVEKESAATGREEMGFERTPWSRGGW